MHQALEKITPNNNIFNFLNFKNSWLFLVFLSLFIYIPQAIYGVYFFNNTSSSLTLKILLIGFISYLLFFLFLKKYLKSSLQLFENKNYSLLIFLTIAVYFLLIIYALATAEKIAIIEALNGKSAEEITLAREMLFKSREGVSKYLIYLYSIFTTALIPYVIALTYIKKYKYRTILLILFCASLLISMEKTQILKALIPLFLLSFNRYIPKYYFKIIAVIAVVVIAGQFTLSKFGSTDPKQEISQSIKKLVAQKIILIDGYKDNKLIIEELLEKIDYEKSNSVHSTTKSVRFYEKQLNFYYIQRSQLNEMMTNVNEQITYYDWAEKYIDKYFIFGSGRLAYVVNRILWIPYVTAYDWILFFQTKLNGEYLYGGTSSVISYLTQQPRYSMEQEVFKFQFGTSAPTSAAANSNFWIDAYVNFGWAGVIAYSSIIAAVTMLVLLLSNPALFACFYYFILQLSMGGLWGVLLSNGLLTLLVLAYFFPINRNDLTPKL